MRMKALDGYSIAFAWNGDALTAKVVKSWLGGGIVRELSLKRPDCFATEIEAQTVLGGLLRGEWPPALADLVVAESKAMAARKAVR